MSKKIFFSIITPTFNRSKNGLLSKAIESIQNQNVGDFTYEHIIVDDGSEDGTKELIAEFARTDKAIKYFYQKNQGTAQAIKKGIEQSKGDYVLILADDDEYPVDSLQKRADYISHNPKIDWFYGKGQEIDANGSFLPTRYQSEFYHDHGYERLLVGNYIHGGTQTIKRGILMRLKWPNWLTYAEDYYMALELMRPENHYSVGYLDEVLYLYRWHEQMYTYLTTIDTSKQDGEKKMLQAIRHTHPDGLVFLADLVRETPQDKDKQIYELVGELAEASNRTQRAEEELKYLRISRVVGTAIKFRDLLRKDIAFIKNIPYHGRDFLADHLSPRAKEILKHIILRERRKKFRYIKNEKWSGSGPLVSVITPTWNRGEAAYKSIASVLNQTFQDFEYIIVDDGSDKVHLKAIRALVSPKIRVVSLRQHEESHTPAIARNEGIKSARGKYVVCVDDDDWLEPTYFEKALAVLESYPDLGLITTHMQMFGAKDNLYKNSPYKPEALLFNNMVITAAMYKREAWTKVGGYKDGIGYEDWEFWVNLAENGFWGKLIPEGLLHYCVKSGQSRYLEDLDSHGDHVGKIKQLHPLFKNKIRTLARKKRSERMLAEPSSVGLNISDPKLYKTTRSVPNVLITIPWMTFGGAETLIFNFCKEIKENYNISFVTGLKSEHEWEYKFKKISEQIYHLANLFEDKIYYLEFISNFIVTRNIEILHVIHNGFMFEMLPELKKRHPKLKVIVTMYNNRVEYFDQSIKSQSFIDTFQTDNQLVAKDYTQKLKSGANVVVIPNGVDSTTTLCPDRFDRKLERQNLGIESGDLALFFVGRLSSEKKPDVFIEVAKKLFENKFENVKLFIIGDGPMKEQIEMAVQNLKNDHIKYLGYQSDVARYLSAADVFILPSEIEGFPLSILEAMSMEVAVVASHVGAVPDILIDGEDGFVVSPSSVTEIYDSVVKLDKDRGLLEKMEKRGRVEVEKKYSNQILGENYINLYNEVLK